MQKKDTFLDIARYYDLGYNEIEEANPGVDPWIPPPGQIVLLPTEWVLPDVEYKGLVVNIPEMRLYYFHPAAQGTVIVNTFPVGLGRDDWRTPSGSFKVVEKTVNPRWVLPESIKAEHRREGKPAPDFIAGGDPDNPLGKYRLRLTLPLYGIHGTDIPWGVGMQVSHGCVRLYPEDIERLFPMVPVGTPGQFIYQPVKVGARDGRVLRRGAQGHLPAAAGAVSRGAAVARQVRLALVRRPARVSACRRRRVRGADRRHPGHRRQRREGRDATAPARRDASAAIGGAGRCGRCAKSAAARDAGRPEPPQPPHELPTQKQIDAALGSARRMFSQPGCVRKIWPRASLTSKVRRVPGSSAAAGAVVAPDAARDDAAEAEPHGGILVRQGSVLSAQLCQTPLDLGGVLGIVFLRLVEAFELLGHALTLIAQRRVFLTQELGAPVCPVARRAGRLERAHEVLVVADVAPDGPAPAVVRRRRGVQLEPASCPNPLPKRVASMVIW